MRAFYCSPPPKEKGLEPERLNEHTRAFMCVLQIQLKAQIFSQVNGFSRSSHDLSISWQQQRRWWLFCNGTSENLSNDTHVENVRLFLSFALSMCVRTERESAFHCMRELLVNNMRICDEYMSCRMPHGNPHKPFANDKL